MEDQSYIDKAGAPKVSIYVWLTALYVVVWYLQLGSRVSILGALRFEFLLGLLLVSMAMLRVFSRPATPLRPYVLSWFAVCLIYIPLSYNVETSWNIFFNRVFKFSMMALFFSVFITNEKELKVVVFAFLLAMLKLGQEGVFGWLGGGLVWQNQGIMRLHGSTELYRHPNSFSGMAVGCLPFIYYLYPVVGRLFKLWLLALLGCALVIVLFTGSRTGYIATILLGAYFYREVLVKNVWKAVVVIAALIPMLFYVPEQYVGRFMSIFTGVEQEGASSAARLKIIEDAIAIFLDNPMGVGLAAFPSIRRDVFGRMQDTHNLYLELLTNVGILGTFVFLALIYKILRVCQSIYRDREVSEFVAAVAKAVFAFVLARLWLGLFGMDAYEIYWWFAIGLTSACYMQVRSGQVRSR